MTPTFLELQTLGSLRSDLVLNSLDTEGMPFAWLLTHQSKATAFTRLLFAMRPWYEQSPRQLDGLRVLSVADPQAVAPWVLWLLADRHDHGPPPRILAPAWVRRNVPWLRRFWGEGLARAPLLGVNEAIFAWSHDDPAGLLRRGTTARRGSAQRERS